MCVSIYYCSRRLECAHRRTQNFTRQRERHDDSRAKQKYVIDSTIKPLKHQRTAWVRQRMWRCWQEEYVENWKNYSREVEHNRSRCECMRCCSVCFVTLEAARGCRRFILFSMSLCWREWLVFMLKAKNWWQRGQNRASLERMWCMPTSTTVLYSNNLHCSDFDDICDKVVKIMVRRS